MRIALLSATMAAITFTAIPVAAQSNGREARREGIHDLAGVVHRERGLGQAGHALRIAHLHALGVLHVLDELLLEHVSIIIGC